ncbi:MAG TPA: hypothetical protein VMD53_07820 [Rhizomicrobium sp.]|nr:hypothetical protein [Rhizomicrobium sp.]
MPYKPYVPQDVGELLDLLAHMTLAAPTFKDKTGYLRRMNIDTTFFSLNEGLQVIRGKLGEERYAKLRVTSDKMRALFESDPEDKTGDTQAGRMLIHEMEDVLEDIFKREASK